MVKPAGTENGKYLIITCGISIKSPEKTLFLSLACVHRASAHYKPQSYTIRALYICIPDLIKVALGIRLLPTGKPIV